MKKTLLLLILLMGTVFVLFPSCDGILGGIYDEEDETSVGEGQVYVDVTSYSTWTYLTFSTNSVATEVLDYTEEPSDTSWHIALHRWDVKTNGGAAYNTGVTSFDEVTFIPDESEFTADVWTDSTIAVDMTEMMSGIIGYTSSYYNEVTSSWIYVDTSSMPPSYTLYNNVYLVLLQDETLLALRLVSRTDANGASGYLTIDYRYPFELSN